MVPRLVIVTLLVFFIHIVNVKAATIVQVPKVNKDWWKNAVVYQIYPRSFKDNDNDGIGDLKGITSKLEHLKDAGVTAAWLSPIYKSPQVDQGYDISDYTKIDVDYGTMEDFEEMVEKAHQLGIKIIMDFVPNHSSDEHEWFEKSKTNDPDYKDYYIWRDGKNGGPPNNWISLFKGSAWTYDDVRKQWYLHQFAVEQPDLNYRSLDVKREMEEILTFWLDKGVDGFRMDAVPYLIEHELFEDEPRSEDPTATPDDYEYLKHTLTSDQEETYDIIYSWRAFIDEYNERNSDKDPRIMMTEAYTSIENTMKYYTDGAGQEGAHFTFNFLFITDLSKNSKAGEIIAVIDKWMENMPEGYVANWVLGNHDNHRVASRFGTERVDGMNMLIAVLPGVMVTYNGEEIGQENGKVTFAECQDPRACKLTEEEYEANSRDFERTPYHWDSSINAGFNTGKKPWLPVSEKYLENNLAKQTIAGVNSHYSVYKDLLKLRQEPGFNSAPMTFITPSDNVIAFTKTVSNDNVYVVVINIANTPEEIDLSEFTNLNKYIKVVVTNSVSKKQDRVLTTNKITLEPYESFIAKSLATKEEGDSNWWKHAVVYQIYPLSFKDDDNSGQGDLKGIISKLDHLKDAGVTAAWLSPIFKSPDVDQGYDISDFKQIDSKFGNMADFEELVKKSHEKGIKIILDFVPNHSSNDHQWFKNSEVGMEEFKDYYVWKSSSTDAPPNNWKSIFGGSAWEYSAIRRQWYLHQFAKEQPDLNYRNPVLVNEMKDVLKFWLDKGVDGFRMDAVPYLVEDENFENEPLIEEGLPGDDYSHYKHIYTSDQKGTFDMIYQWRDYVDDYTKEYGGDARLLMTEAYTDIENTMKYYGDGADREGAHFTFNFQLITKLNKESTATDVEVAIKEWLTHMPNEYTANWVLGNHDQHRVATRFGTENVDGFNMLTAILPGVMVTYNGEEIGQENGDVPYDKCKDPSVCGKGEEVFKAKGRDFERTPFHWDDTVNAGFNTGKEPWLPVSDKYTDNNLAAQSKDNQKSHYQLYKQLLELRKQATLDSGSFEMKVLSNNVLSCLRTLEDSDTYIYLFNIGNAREVVNVKDLLSTVTSYLDIVLTDTSSSRTRGQLLSSQALSLDAHESIIVKTTTKEPDDDDGAASVSTGSILVLFTSLFYILAMN